MGSGAEDLGGESSPDELSLPGELSAGNPAVCGCRAVSPSGTVTCSRGAAMDDATA